MDRIAFISEGTTVYWNSIILTLAAATAVCFFLAFYLGKTGNAAAGFAAVPASIFLGLIFSRFFHWYFRPDGYTGFLSAMGDLYTGGYALMGVFLGCFLTAALLRLLRLHGDLPEMLDCMSLAGAAGISVGRLASMFNSSDRGQVMEHFKSLPFAYPVTNAVSGAVEYRFATFLFQAIVAFLIFLALSRFYRKGGGRKKSGDTCIIFLMCYGASQVVLDSTRYDSLFFRSNGFVSIVQVLGAIALVGAIVIFSARLVKNRGFKFWYVFLWVLIAAVIGVAGFMEYYVQRHGSTALFSYSMMSLCLAAAVALTLLIRALSGNAPGKNRNVIR